MWIPIIFALMISNGSARVIETQQEPENSLGFLGNVFSYFQDNKESIFSFYENARLISDVLTLTDSPLMESVVEIISLKSSSGRSPRSFDFVDGVTHYVPKTINNWIIPQILDKVNASFQEFMQSPLGKVVTEQVNVGKVRKIFADEKTGNFSYDKFVELMENQAFRKHWISVVTKKVSSFISFYSDPATHRRFASPVLTATNNFLQKIGIPTSKLLDLSKPGESLSGLMNYMFENYLFYTIDSKKYVEPIIAYIQNLFLTAKEIVAHKTNPNSLEDILVDTINMDIIEPTLRVNRAYRFILKYPYCDRYVMCIVNTEEKDDPKLPGVKKALSKGTSLLASWFLAGKTKSSFVTLYTDVMRNNHCNFIEPRDCQHFHIEELKVKEPYRHREL